MSSTQTSYSSTFDDLITTSDGGYFKSPLDHKSLRLDLSQTTFDEDQSEFLNRVNNFLEKIDWNKVDAFFSSSLMIIERFSLAIMDSQKISELMSLYTVESAKNVRVYLLMYPYLLKPLAQLPKITGKFFPGAQLVLQLVHDEELNQSQLVVNIGTKQDVKESLESLDGLDDEWWLEQFAKYGDKICLNLQFQ